MTGLKIRPAEVRDVPTLGRLGALLVSVHHDFDRARFIPVTPQTEAEYGAFLAGEIGDPAITLLVAEDGRDVLGYCYGRVEGVDFMALRGPAGIVYDLIVDPGQRGRGIGRRLIEAMLAALEARGAPQISLFTADGNRAAQHLFASLGFRRTMVEMTIETGRA